MKLTTHLFAFLSFIWITSAVPVTSTPELRQLTGDNFSTQIQHGLWLIEFFSPYCGHCRKFKPIWTRLVSEAEPSAPFGFDMAQVDCIAHGDLCSEQKVEYYPMLVLHQDGKRVGVYDGDRSYEDLTRYINDHVRDYVENSRRDSHSIAEAPNQSGEVQILDSSTFSGLISEGPVFVKFFAPWCGHCKKLAPVWKELATRMKGVVNIAQVDCEAHGSLCQGENVQGYPTLAFYNDGKQVVYNGGRTLAALEPWVTKAVKSSAGMQWIKAEDLTNIASSNPVAFLYLHTPNAPATESSLVLKASHSILGTPTYQSSDPALFTDLGIDPTGDSLLLVFKDHYLEPAEIFRLPDTTTLLPLERWMTMNRFPSALELTSTNFQEIMRASWSPIIVLAPVERADSAQTEKTLAEANKLWKSSASDTRHPALFVWMDLDRWESWLKKMYGATRKGGPTVILADHGKLLYYDVDPTEAPIRLDATHIVSTLDAIALGSITAKHSENMAERFARNLHESLETLAVTVGTHPFLSVLVMAVSLGSFFLWLQRSVRSDVRDATRPPHRYGKGDDRLD